jgi:hypothetical protein
MLKPKPEQDAKGRFISGFLYGDDLGSGAPGEVVSPPPIRVFRRSDIAVELASVKSFDAEDEERANARWKEEVVAERQPRVSSIGRLSTRAITLDVETNNLHLFDAGIARHSRDHGRGQAWEGRRARANHNGGRRQPDRDAGRFSRPDRVLPAPLHPLLEKVRRYNFACAVTESVFADITETHMRRHYFQIMLVAQFRAAALLAFSNWVSEAMEATPSLGPTRPTGRICASPSMRSNSNSKRSFYGDGAARHLRKIMDPMVVSAAFPSSAFNARLCRNAAGCAR